MIEDRIKALEIALQAQFELNKTFSGQINKLERELNKHKNDVDSAHRE